MKRCTHWLVATIAAMGLVGCGGDSGGGGGGGPEKKEEPQSEEEVVGYNYDFAQMSLLNSTYAGDFDGEPKWDVRVSVNGEEKASLADASMVDVKAGLSSLQFKHYDIVRTEMTVKSEDGKVLATNLESVAHADEDLKAIWEAECKLGVNPEHEIQETDYEFVDGENKLMLRMGICDFAGFALKSVIQIKPQKKSLAKKLVIYHCEFEPDYASTSSTSPYIERYTGDTKCGYGYETLPDETAPKIEILKDYAPGTSLYNQKILRFDDVKLGLGNAGQMKLTTDFYAPPFGSLEACHTIKLDVKFANDSGIQTKRLEFKRSNQTGGVLWMPQDADDWPSMNKIAQYYKTATNEKVHLYRFCDWIPEARDLNAGNVVTIQTN